MADEQNTAAFEAYAKTEGSKAFGKDLERYAKSSAKFASVGGAVGSVFPGVGTAIGGVIGAGAGIAVEGIGDLIDAFGSEEMKRVKESPEKAEAAYYVYEAMGGQRGTGLAYKDWWKLYVAAGRPSVEVLRSAQVVAKRLERGDNPLPPPPPPPPSRASSAPNMILIETPSGRVHTGSFVADERGKPGVLVELPSGRATTGAWS